MRIVTISREFGSGGRELGKRLADLLECDYYDKEIITAIAANQNLDEEYVARTLDNRGWEKIPLSFRHTFISSTTSMQTVLLLEQKKIIEQIAKLERKIRSIDKNRSQTREMITERKWGDRMYYHLVVNTTDWTIKELTPAVKTFVECWFRRKNEHSII